MKRMLMIYNWLLAPIPGTRAMRLKIWWLRKCGIVIGDDCYLAPNVRFELHAALVKIGCGVHIDSQVLFKLSGAEVVMGDHVSLQDDVRFYAEGEKGQVILSDHVVVRKAVHFEFNGGGRIEIGEDSEVNHGTLLAANCGAKITVGKHVRIAHFISMKCSTHEIDSQSVTCIAGKSIMKDIRIGDGSWVCGSATVLPGVSVGRFNVVAAGAVVTKDTPDNVLVAGVPAVVKKIYCRLEN